MQQQSSMRKPLIVLISIVFTGALLFYTANANLNLLQQLYPDPQYVAFGMIALEGGVIYWLGYYLLHWDNNHKAIALVMTVIDFAISMLGFFMDLNLHSGNAIKTALPPALIVMTFDIILNVGVGLLVHFMNHTKPTQPAQYYNPQAYVSQQQSQPAQVAQPKEENTYSQMATIEAPRIKKQLPPMGKPGRKSTDEKHARRWYKWEDTGFNPDACPWNNASEMRNHYPRLARQEVGC